MSNGGKRLLSEDHLLEEKEREETLRVPVPGRRINGYRPRLRESLPPPPEMWTISGSSLPGWGLQPRKQA